MESVISTSKLSHHQDIIALQVENLSISSRKGMRLRPILTEISFSLPWGHSAFIIGRSGTGKSLIVRAILGLLNSNEWELEGNIWVGHSDHRQIILLEDGEYRPQGYSEIRGKSIAAVFQGPSSHLHPSLSVGNQICEALSTIPREQRKEKAQILFNSVDIKNVDVFRCYPFQFSQGECQRITIGMALALQGLLIVDEPTASVDEERRDEIISIFREQILKHKFNSMVVVTHQEAVISQLIKSGDIIVGLYESEIRGRIFTARTTVWKEEDQIPVSNLHPCFAFHLKPEAARSPTPDLLYVEHLSQYYRRNFFSKRKVVFDDINFHIAHGEMVGIVGPSGSGKSTIAKAIIRIINNTKGQLFFFDSHSQKYIDLAALQPHSSASDVPQMNKLRRQIQYISQEAGMIFNPSLIVYDVLDESFNLAGYNESEARDKLMLEWLYRMRLIKDDNEYSEFILKFPNELSGGEKQRLSLLRCFLLKPALIIADEPFSDQDLQTAAEMIDIMKSYQNSAGTAFILISHDRQLVKNICNRVYELDDKGKLTLL